MSANYTGVTFAQQKVTPSDDAIIRRAIFPDGILTGCELTYTGSTLTMTAGQLMICGRQIRHPSTQNWAVVDATSGYARLLLTIDLTRTSSKDVFDQVIDSIEYATSVDGFPELEQTDINGAGTRYQVVACIVSLSTGGISGIMSQLDKLEGGGGSGKSEIIVTAPSGSTVTATCGSITKTASEKNGKLILHGLELGAWTIKVDLAGSDRMALLVSLTRPSIKYVTFDFTTREAYVDQSSLVVKTRAGSTVTASNWSATYTTLAIDGEATFEDLELGEWTITALHPEQKNPAEESISLVRPEIVYIELNYELYLYKAGDECIDVTGGWTSIAKNSSSSALASPRAPDVTRNPSSINIKLPKGTEGYSGIFCATKSVDLTRYSTLRAYGTFINGLSEKNDTFAMYVWSNLGKFFKDNVVGATMIEVGTNTYEVRLPIDAMSGEHYVGFGLNTRMGAMEMTITEITIE